APSKPLIFMPRALAAILCLAAWPALAAAPADQPTAPAALEATLAGEYALQGGQLQEAASWYLRAAQAAPGDAALAERAARIALLAGDDVIAAAALDLWRDRAPRTLPMRAIEASLALRRGEEARATRLAIALARVPDGWRHVLTAIGSGSRDMEMAGRVIDALVDADAVPPQLEAWLALGGLAQRLDQPALGERIVDEVVSRFQGEPRVALLRASQLREAGDVEGARAALAQVEVAAASDE